MQFRASWSGCPATAIMPCCNGAALDYHVLLAAVHQAGLTEKWSSCAGFVDTLPFLKAVLPGMSSYTLTSLHEQLIGCKFVAHDSAAEVAALQMVMVAAKADRISLMVAHSSSLASTDARCSNLCSRNARLTSLKGMVSAKALSSKMAAKVAGSGLQFGHLQRVFARDGRDGLRAVLSKKGADGKPRVTKNTSVLDAVYSFFESDTST